MDQPKLILVTHKDPDLDAMAAIYLWLTAHGISWDEYDKIYELRFINPGQRLEENSLPDPEKYQIIHFDTGRKFDKFNFDHHQLNDRDISATGLVWKQFFTPGQFPALDELAITVNHIDNGKEYRTEDLEVRLLFSFGKILAGSNKDLQKLYQYYQGLMTTGPDLPQNDFNQKREDYTHTMIVGFSIIDSFQANWYESKIYQYLTSQSLEIFDTQFGKTVVLNNIPGKSSSVRSFMKKNFNGKRGPLVNTCIVKFVSGSIGVIVCIDPINNDNNELDDLDESDDNHPQKISLSCEMEELCNSLREMDQSQDSNIYLHYSRFSLFVNRSRVIRLEDVLKLIRIKL